jgi:hypothetical protein
MSAVAMNTVAFAPLAAVRSTKRVAQKAAAPVRVAAGTSVSRAPHTAVGERSSHLRGGRRSSPFAQRIGHAHHRAGDHARGREGVQACARPLRVRAGGARGRSDHQGSGSMRVGGGVRWVGGGGAWVCGILARHAELCACPTNEARPRRLPKRVWISNAGGRAGVTKAGQRSRSFSCSGFVGKYVDGCGVRQPRIAPQQQRQTHHMRMGWGRAAARKSVVVCKADASKAAAAVTAATTAFTASPAFALVRTHLPTDWARSHARPACATPAEAAAWPHPQAHSARHWCRARCAWIRSGCSREHCVTPHMAAIRTAAAVAHSAAALGITAHEPRAVRAWVRTLPLTRCDPRWVPSCCLHRWTSA